MSIPTSSIGPTGPAGSSNPVSLKGWFNIIIDWIKGLSPSGASVYDTGWVTCPPATGFTSTCQVRRIGKNVIARGSFSPTANGSIGATYIVMGNLPAGFMPAVAFQASGAANIATALQANFANTGAIAMRTFGTVTSYTPSNFFSISGNTWAVD